ncbi:hypothetical protein M569_08443 [Genlisea aurea]|uniref:Uncharacterized protein n=1 Tax=Genlisea aurea TaxID=192259 RepID=S8CHD1_9LAMI|nr:hypothetical protein M569_08443 [Genlisea aurea]
MHANKVREDKSTGTRTYLILGCAIPYSRKTPRRFGFRAENVYPRNFGARGEHLSVGGHLKFTARSHGFTFSESKLPRRSPIRVVL